MTHRLTKREKDLLIGAAEFMLAGEWPDEDDSDAKQERDQRDLRAACDKLRGKS